MKKRLTKSLYDKRICGICGGAAEYFDTDSTIIRVIFVIFAFLTGIIPAVLLYLVLACVIPNERDLQYNVIPVLSYNSNPSPHPQKGKGTSLCTRWKINCLQNHK